MVPNQLLENSQLSVQERYFYIVLLRFCGKKDYCFPSQKTLGKKLGYSDRQIRKYITKLISYGLISSTQKGFNRANTYYLSKELDLKTDRNSSSYHLGTRIPLHTGHDVPTKNTYGNIRGKSRDKHISSIQEILKNKYRKERLV